MSHLPEAVPQIVDLSLTRDHITRILEQGLDRLEERCRWQNHLKPAGVGEDHLPGWIKTGDEPKDTTPTSLLLMVATKARLDYTLHAKGRTLREEAIERFGHFPPLFTASIHPTCSIEAAFHLQAASAESSLCFHAHAMLALYHLVREIYTVSSPDWVIGSVRLSEKGRTSAFVTSEAIRAIRSLADTLERTADFARELYRTEEKWRATLTPAGLDNDRKRSFRAWSNAERKRIRRALAIRVVEYGSSTLFGDPTAWGETEDVEKWIAHGKAGACKLIEESSRQLADAIKMTDRFAPPETVKGEKTHAWHLFSKTGHEFGLTALVRTKEVIDHHWKEICDKGRLSLYSWDRSLRDNARRIRSLCSPATSYLRSVLDQQITSVTSAPRSQAWTPADLIFSAATISVLENSFGHRDRIEWAAKILSEEITSDGSFFSTGPTDGAADGTAFCILQANMLRGFAQLFAGTSVTIPNTVAHSLLNRLQENCVYERHDPERIIGWTWDGGGAPAKAAIWSTGLHILALLKLKKTLAIEINERVLEHFNYETPQQGDALELRDLFYTDYGLFGDDSPSNLKTRLGEIGYRESVACATLRAKAHLLGAAPAPGGPLLSAVLAGPPGTGKTTLPKALANTCNVSLVTITPSDILAAGENNAELQAKSVFLALGCLERCVILLDEFDQLLLDRDYLETKENRRSMFSFLTPSLLPKIKHLHDEAKKRHTVFFLATNRAFSLDSAAVRRGRFDAVLPIFPPDRASRLGRVLSQLSLASQLCNLEDSVNREHPTALNVERVDAVLAASHMGGMTDLGKSLSFADTKHRLVHEEAPVYQYLLGKAESPGLDFGPEYSHDFYTNRERKKAAKKYSGKNLYDLELELQNRINKEQPETEKGSHLQSESSAEETVE